jgi:hypothetical protein
VSGRRALIQFSPGLVSSEKLTAGVVLQLVDGSVHVRTALDSEKAEHAFGHTGTGHVQILGRALDDDGSEALGASF